ncbi:hypothetical protein RchiOBHm_Chr1g0330951 [Rosa chinensis]|uniref:Uncharacterized protein n=1 Tax=Rosa chinensis TaxID=74649 RepID=A0A2P6SBD6_ROSCH|nr:hypothetical protein RchiOBHm_Chr1g0330951 [Rosa chinensis]
MEIRCSMSCGVSLTIPAPSKFQSQIPQRILHLFTYREQLCDQARDLFTGNWLANFGFSSI